MHVATATAATAEGKHIHQRPDLATRHEKTLHIDQYGPPDRTQQQSPLTGPQTLSPDSPPSGSAASPSQVVGEVESQASTATTSQPAENVSEAEAWTALLGLDGFDPFSYDGSLNEFTFLASSATGPEVPTVRISDAVISSLRSSLGPEDRQTPTPAALRLFLGTYFDVFNVHMPLLHAPSFDFDSQPHGLLLAILRASVCVKVGTPRLTVRGLGSLQWLGGDV
ncbi:hypothetical protein INS49_003291 [Diaporthe citri]|uniref:uncharacterized protein n=1 Tax=Diaporthe citri TaxID=83186 RepID=UPI001C827D20|nr:uncharacterized protein INS49_003291 [Diaporthe citri]KAG6355330.1 hypothetical protein INS49_003291 [Diaporthe citri]